jgi:tRNA 2-thiouridine synthesizing protein A
VIAPLAGADYSTHKSAMHDPMGETILNLRGLKCPLPALKVRKALSRLAAGERLVAECTDPLAAVDIPNLIRETGDLIEEMRREADVLVFRICKAVRA